MARREAVARAEADIAQSNKRVLIIDAADPYKFVEVRGSVTMTHDGGPELIEQLSQAYEGERYTGDNQTTSTPSALTSLSRAAWRESRCNASWS